MQKISLLHCTINCSDADINSMLLQGGLHSVYTVIYVVWMLCDYLFYSDQKKLTGGLFMPVRKPSVISRLADFKKTAHLFDCKFFLVFQHKQMPFACFYFFRSFAKKPRASFKMSLALSSSAFFFSSSRIRAFAWASVR